MKLGIGIDLGGTNIKGAAFDLDLGEEIARATVPTRDGEFDDGVPAWAAGVREVLLQLEAKAGSESSVVGLSAPGLADRNHEAIRFMPGRLEGLEDFAWGTYLQRPTTVLNDAHAALIGEIWKGAAKDVADVFLLTLGTGVGGAIVSGGQLITGHLGRAGHLGHISLDPNGQGDICGTPGSLEDRIGDCTIRHRTKGRFKSTEELVEAARSHDNDARIWWDATVTDLAAGIAGLINVLDPELILLGGGIAKAGAVLFEPLEEKLASFEWRPNDHRVKIRGVELGEWAGCYGAVHFADTQPSSPAKPSL